MSWKPGAEFPVQVLVPGDPGYEEARRVHNGLIDKRPAAIVRCVSTADVVDAVRAGQDQELEISVRGGGHSVGGRAVTDGGLMIDLSRMKGIHVDPLRRTVRAQGGVIWGEYNRATAVFGLATTGGVISTTGIAGLTLGGGIGWLMGRHGLAIDNLLSAEVVLASGAVETASEDQDADLFWAIRGGGGNFGVVSSFEYRAHPLVTVLGGPIVHPISAAASFLALLRELADNLPDDLTVEAGLRFAPGGSGAKVFVPVVCHAGEDPQRAEADVRPLRDFGSPVADRVARIPYPVLNTLLDSGFPRGTLNYWKSGFFADLSEDAVNTMVEAFEQAPTPLCLMLLEQHRGASTRVPATATAYPHREPGFNLILAAQWTDPADTDRSVRWARETFQALSPFMANRAYANYLTDDAAARVHEAYGPNYDRLVRLKRRYDPGNLFRLNVNISPD